MLLNILKAGESSMLPGAVNLIRAERGEKTCRIFRGVDEDPIRENTSLSAVKFEQKKLNDGSRSAEDKIPQDKTR